VNRLILVAALLAGCGEEREEPAPPAVTVWAAASLTDILPKVARAHGEEVTFSFDASSRLARQIEAGAPADLFFSADEEWMDYLEERERIVTASRIDLLTNRLVVVVPREDRRPLRSLAELGDGRYERIGTAGENVPAARYAEAALRSAGAHDAVAPRLVRGETVRTALAWAARGEVDASLVYATDAASERRVRVALVIPEELHPPIVYPVAVLRTAPSREAAESFLAFASGPRARSLFEEAGFGELPGPR
jgi:molybdate transport system substrate-binding protein